MMADVHMDDRSSETTALATVEAFLGKARGAMVRQGRIARAARGFAVGSVVAAVAIVAARFAGWSVPQVSWLLLIAPIGALVGLVLSRAAKTPDVYGVAKQIDQQLGLKDRLAGGYDLLRQGRLGELGAFGRLIVQDALAAVEEARRAYRPHKRLPLAIPMGVGCLAVVMGIVALLPQWGSAAESAAISAQQRQQAQALNNSLASMAEAIKGLEGVDEKQQEAMLEALRQVQISEEDLKNMSRADIIRRLRDASSTIKLPEGTQGAAVRQAMEDKLRAVAEMEQVQKQLAQIEQLNARSAAIDLGSGNKAVALNITLESSDLQIDKAVAVAASKAGEAEQDYQNRLASAEARAKSQRDAIKKFLARGGDDIPHAEAQKLASMMASDAEFQGKVMDAIKDPSGKKLDDMRTIYRRQLQRELEKENIPRGLRQQLSTYLGPVGTAPDSNPPKGATR
jgi:hypothetical protein